MTTKTCQFRNTKNPLPIFFLIYTTYPTTMKNNLLFDPGLFLRKLRVSHKFSQQHVANFLGISRNAYAEWENGHTELTLGKLGKICELYEITVHDFVTRIPLEKSA